MEKRTGRKTYSVYEEIDLKEYSIHIDHTQINNIQYNAILKILKVVQSFTYIFLLEPPNLFFKVFYSFDIHT